MMVVMEKYKNILFYTTLFLLILAFSTTAHYLDFDLWARLIAGMGVIDGGHVLKADFLSYTPVHTWWDHEWGSGVIFYAFLKLFGPYSLIILQAILLFGIFYVLSKIVKLRTNISSYNFLFYFFGLMAVMQNLNNPIRCHLFSFLFFTIFLYILEKVRKDGSYKLLCFIPIITVFWNNIHGGVVSGIGLLLMYALGEFLNKRPFKKYLITFLISSLSLFINPWGYDYIRFLLMANTMKRPDIMEWWGIFSKFHMFKQIPFKLFMFFTIIVSAISNIKLLKSESIKTWFTNLDKVKAIVLLSTLYLSVTHVKLIPFFVITAIAFTYEDFYKLIKNIKFPKYKDKLIYGLLLVVSAFSLTVKNLSVPLDFETYPVKEVEFIKINKIKGNILVNFGLGSYVSYKLYPQNLIFMDGRYEEVYYDYMVPLLKQFFLANNNWDEVLVKFPPDCMIIENYYPIYNVLLNSSNWNLVYKGTAFGVFLPQSKVKKNYIQPSNDINYYKNTLFDTGIKFYK